MAGLGARGLLYHSWLGRLVAQAVLEGDEQVLPEELRRWQGGHASGHGSGSDVE